MHPWTIAPSRVLSLLLLLTASGAIVRAAEPDGPPRRNVAQRPILPLPTGAIIKVADNSITVRPISAPAKGGPSDPEAAVPADPAAAQPAAASPAEQTFVIDKLRTRIHIEVVTNERMTNTGQRIRSSHYDPGELADLEAGQWVRVNTVDGVATEIAIVPDPNAPLPRPATIVKVGEKSITVAPDDPRPLLGVVGGNNAPATRPAERTYATDAEKTRVTLTTVTAERMAPGGGIVRVLSMQRGTLADLKPGQLIEVRARKDVAVDIRVVPPPAPNPRPAPAAKPKAAES